MRRLQLRLWIVAGVVLLLALAALGVASGAGRKLRTSLV
jgi:hypothetical protein